ncbi:MAG TPA: glycosyltransferase family 4 protein [Nitriliruptorales bacterium]|nr:glycosyltransferase family 4 protein [Nitriliruptorales bacterium]
MKVLVAGRYGGANGIETYTCLLVRGLRQAGHEVILADRSEQPTESQTRAHRVERLAPRRHRMRQLAGPFEGRSQQRHLVALGRSAGVDVIHATYTEFVPPGPDRPRTVFTAWNPNVAVLRRTLSAHSRSERAWEQLLYGTADRLAAGRADQVIAVSRAVESGLTAAGHPATWIPPFIPDEQVQLSRRRRSRTCVMVAGVVDHPRKGFDLAVDAVRAARSVAPKLELLLVGGWSDPGRRDALPSFCHALGPLAPADVRTVLGDAGCCVIPSVWEEFGYVALEALAVGTPVVCGPLPGLVGLQTDGLVVAGERAAATFGHAIATALDLTSCAFPAACRLSQAIPRIVGLYDGRRAAADDRTRGIR